MYRKPDQSLELKPRDIVKLAMQYQETDILPYYVPLTEPQQHALKERYQDAPWWNKQQDYMYMLQPIDGFLFLNGMEKRGGNLERDSLGCTWDMGSTHHLVDWPLHEPKLGDYRLPDLETYYQSHLSPVWQKQLAESQDCFRLGLHVFGLFERAWSLRGFENLLMDLAGEETFVEELLDHVMEWLLQGVDMLARAPIDGIMFTDDHAAQRGMIMGAQRWRRLFKPRWKIIFDRVHHYGLYTILHMCGDNHEVAGDLIEVGLDCMESCQPECMDIYALKKEFGRDIRFWGGLGVQHLLPFGTPEDIREQTRRLKDEMGAGGGYILSPAKGPDAATPIENIAAFLEEAVVPRRAETAELLTK